MTLTEQERAVLAAWKAHETRRDLRLNAFADLGLSETRATQIVNGLIDRPEAWEVEPLLMGRLSQRRAGRRPRPSSPSRRDVEPG